MAASRLTDSQKTEMVARYRNGEGSGELAASFGCSVNTVSRVMKAALPASEYEQLKRERARTARQGSGAKPGGWAAGAGGQAAGVASAASQNREELKGTDRNAADLKAIDLKAVDLDADDLAAADPDAAEFGGDEIEADVFGEEDLNDEDLDDEDLDDEDLDAEAFDADDFDGEDSDTDDLDTEELDGEELDEQEGALGVGGSGSGGETARGPGSETEAEPVRCLPLWDADLAGSVYMLVDKTVELDARPLREFSELGPLPEDEEERQALQVFINPRQAKRQCGRSQRVIKLPDAQVLERTASYLLAKGISRVVIEGSLYALPGA